MNTRGRPDLRNTPRETLTEHGGVCPAIPADKIALIDQFAQAAGRPIDLTDLRQADEPLPGQILKQGERLLGRDEDYAARLSRHLFDAAGFPPSPNCILAGKRLPWIDHQSNRRSLSWTTSILR